jgi:translation initiation factor 4E
MRKESRKYPPSALCVARFNVRVLYSHLAKVESFWSLWTHLSPPSALQPTTDYLLFHSGIRRPVWEDPVNISGGKWIIRLKKGVTDRLWEDLVLAIIGDQFDECNGGAKGLSWEDKGEHGSDWPEICGCTISVRQSEDIVTLWNKVDADSQVREKIRYVALQTRNST